MEFDRRYKQLNKLQKEAVDHIDGPLMVIAGPGTGKTELLSIRVANILKKTDTLPENILCLTFTDSGATAMRERLVGIIGKDAYKVSIHTFHSFGSEIINKFREYFYNNAVFAPADDVAQYEILQSIFKELYHSNPLSVTMNGEFTYLKEAKVAISELKRYGGMTSDELLAIIQQDEICLDAFDKTLLPIISQTSSVKLFGPLNEILPELKNFADSLTPLYNIQPLAKVLVSSLMQALQEAEEINKSQPLTAWKNIWIGTNEQKQKVFKDRLRLTKLKALSFVYYEYLRRMEAAGLYDYDDMILQVIHAIEVHDDLKATLQEQCLYIMVDEFQDTNNAQMRILQNLTDNEANHGQPNIMTVGDDDQAIYSFQGAEVSNMLRFRDKYEGIKTVVLTDNYRSGETILSASREVILQGVERLERQIPELIKALAANRSDSGKLNFVEHVSAKAERAWVATEIEKLVQQSGDNDPPSVAVLARNHEELVRLLPHLQEKGLPVRYEKQDNALDQPAIKQLEVLARTVVALAKGRHQEANELLPELLAHPAWKVGPKDIWKLSLNAYNSRQDWMTTMSTTPTFVPIHELLTGFVVASQHQPLETMLDIFIGRNDDNPSPLFEYFFNSELVEKNPDAYLDHLSALSAVRNKLHDHKSTEVPNLEDFVEFIDTYRRLNVTITTPRKTRGSDTFAVNLLTAHKAKGLEFDHVYVIHSTDNKWGQSARGKSRSLSYPQNLSLAPAGDSADERLRLFYVAMTRARSNLTISYPASDDKERPMLPADFLADVSFTAQPAPKIDLLDEIKLTEVDWRSHYTETPRSLLSVLQPRLENYKLSATAFTSFLDVTKGGPRAFLLDNLLKFPRSSSPAIAYGNAVHYALQQAHLHVIAKGEPKPLEDTLHDFEEALKKERLSSENFEQLLQKGSDHLPTFISQTPMTENQRPELSFNHQNVVFDQARLSGKIDVATFNEEDKSVTLTDYKTGRPPLSAKGSSDYEKVKLHNYHRQLLFYKLLIQGSRDYSKYTVTKGSVAFVEPNKSGIINVIDEPLDDESTDRQIKLIKAVWRRIMELDLPDTSSYPQNLKGIEAFEQDLIDGEV